MFWFQNILRKHTDCLVHLCIIWFLSYQNFSDESCIPSMLSMVTVKWRISIHFSFLPIKVFHLLQQSHKSINISECDCESRKWLTLLAEVQREKVRGTKNAMSLALKRPTVKCTVHVLSFFYSGGLLLRTRELYFLLFNTETSLQKILLFKSRVWRTRFALILNLDCSPFHQDKLMQVSIPLSSSSQGKQCFPYLPLSIWWGLL